ncbi:MAG: 4'-phosphopantetheinyl transferase superfamily protein [Crocosphaera sp.]|nr:4'-phosphopantetheinyl transferase superfamily protein [Crocosphaera sp.]
MNLDLSKEKVHKKYLILSEDEKKRANSFKFEIHQNRFIIARSTLKFILSCYLDIPAEEINFQYSPYGKPQLVNNLQSEGLKFNVSHSENLAIYGISRHHLIGIDIEYLRPMKEAEKLAERFFSSKEFEAIKSLSTEKKEKAFFQLWTAKEAYLKAIGKGISGGLEQVEISLREPMELIKVPEKNQSSWELLSFTPHPNYIAAMVVEAKKANITYYEFQQR